MVKYLAIATLKGGVGKSTTALMLADTFALNEKLNCLVVDLDPQANLSQMILSSEGLKVAKDAGFTITKWVNDLTKHGEADFVGSIRGAVCGLDEINRQRKSRTIQGKRCDVAILSATPELRFAEMGFDHRNYSRDDQHAPRKKMQDAMFKGLKSLGGTYDVVIFDCPPGFTTLAQTALSMADAIVSPLLEDPVSYWSLVAFRDFGLKESLQSWDPTRHRVLYTRVQSKGGVEDRAQVRNDVRNAGFTPLEVFIRDYVQAFRWAQRAGLDSHETFNAKYDKAKKSVKDLGAEVAHFLNSTPQKLEK